MVQNVISGLRRLEYRGYDSAGIGFCQAGAARLQRRRAEGGVDGLARAQPGELASAALAVGHTRWATHGPPSSTNAHPHFDCTARLGVVHNGVVENFGQLRAELVRSGHRLESATDSELLIHLVERQLDQARPADDAVALVEAVRSALIRTEGAHACVVFTAGHPDLLVCARRGTAGGLRVALHNGCAYVASDGTALASVTGAVSAAVVPADTVAVVTPESVFMIGLFDPDPVPVRWKPLPGAAVLDRTPIGDQVEAPVYFREIREQPSVLTRQARVVRDMMNGAVGNGTSRDLHLMFAAVREQPVRSVRLMACGTPLYACLIARDYIQSLAGLPAAVEHAHEFAHNGRALVLDTDIVVIVSQSGETADSLLALTKAKAAGALCVAVTNSIDSSLDQAADVALYTACGPEYSVAQTKAFTSAVVTLLGFACTLAVQKGVMNERIRRLVAHDVDRLGDLSAQTLQLATRHLPTVVDRLAPEPGCLFLGRSLHYPVALEGALKLKELSYVHAEGYPAGELKHGPIALIEPGFPVVAIVGCDESRPQMLAHLAEVCAREAQVVAVAEEDDIQTQTAATLVLPLPSGATRGLLAPVLSVLPLQMLAGLVAQARGCNVDRPRNLAKSVTVI